MNNPINRTTVQVEENKYRIYGKAGPINYKKPDGTFDTIDHTFNDTTSSIGDISLMDKGVLSVGKRKGNNPYKVVGIRPDGNQHLGTQQLEFSLINVEFDGVSQDFNVETDLEIKLKASRVFQLVKTNESFQDCKIEFDIYAKGLELKNNKYSQTTTIRDYGFNIRNLGELEGGNTEFTLDKLFTEDKTIPYIDCSICKITNNYITTGEYSLEEEFGDSDLSGYILDDSVYPNGSSVYYKDSIILVAKSYNIDTESMVNIFETNMCNKYGLETIWEDGKNGKYFTKDGKKVAGYDYNGDKFYMFINTKAIPDDIKTLFQRKTFESTSYLDITLSDFTSHVNTMFNKNLKLDVDTNYYEPINGNFYFKINNEDIWIKEPIAFDLNYNKLNYYTTHTLKENADGSYRYTKLLQVESALSHNKAKYIDTNLSVTGGEDIRPYARKTSTSVSSRQASWFEAWRNSTPSAYDNSIGVNGNNADVSNNYFVGSRNTYVTLNSTSTYNTYNYQSHYLYDTSGITDTVTEAKHVSVKLHYEAWDLSGLYNSVHVIFLQSTTDAGAWSTSNTEWNEFTGHTTDWDSDDVVEYTGEVTDWTSTSYTSSETALNSTAEGHIKDNDTFAYAIIEHDSYYSNSNTGEIANNVSTARVAAEYQVDHSTTGNRPYLEVTTDTPSGYGNTVMGVASSDISTVKGVATAKISKVIGV